VLGGRGIREHEPSSRSLRSSFSWPARRGPLAVDALSRPRLPKRSRFLQKCPRISQNVPESPELSRNLQNCPGISKIVPEYPEVSPNFPNCPRISRTAPIRLPTPPGRPAAKETCHNAGGPPRPPPGHLPAMRNPILTREAGVHRGSRQAPVVAYRCVFATQSGTLRRRW
jgi:hypothetical protein